MAAKTRQQVAVVEYKSGCEWWAMLPSGRVEVLGTAEDALRAVLREANRGNRGVTYTRIEWRDCPDGFVPPTIEGD